ncbi:hypothetical protein XENORESO_009785, partial [Xenotaenia resolanae]
FLCKRGCPPRQQTVHKMKRSIWKKLFLLVHSLQASIYLPVHSLLSDIWSLFDRDLCGNSMFQQRRLICVMPVVWKGKTLIYPLFTIWIVIQKKL